MGIYSLKKVNDGFDNFSARLVVSRNKQREKGWTMKRPLVQ